MLFAEEQESLKKQYHDANTFNKDLENFEWGDVRTYPTETIGWLSNAISKGYIKYTTDAERGGSSIYAKNGNTSNSKCHSFRQEYSNGYFSPQGGHTKATISSKLRVATYDDYNNSPSYKAFLNNFDVIITNHNESRTNTSVESYWAIDNDMWTFFNTSYNDNIYVYYKEGAFYNGEYYDVKAYYWTESTVEDSTDVPIRYSVLSSGSISNGWAGSARNAQAFTQVHCKFYFFKSSDYPNANADNAPANSKAVDFKGVFGITDLDAGEGVKFISGVQSDENVYLYQNTFVKKATESTIHGLFNEFFNTQNSSTEDGVITANDEELNLLYIQAMKGGASSINTTNCPFIATTGFNTTTHKYDLAKSTVPTSISGTDGSYALTYVGSFDNVSSNYLLGNDVESMMLWAEFSSTASEPFEITYFSPSTRCTDIAYKGLTINYKAKVEDNNCLSSSKKTTTDLATDYADYYGTYTLRTLDDTSTDGYTAEKSLLQKVKAEYGDGYTVQGIYTDSTFKTLAPASVSLGETDLTYYVLVTPTYNVTAVTDAGATLLTDASVTGLAETSSTNTKLVEGSTATTVKWEAKKGYIISDVKIEAIPATDTDYYGNSSKIKDVSNTAYANKNYTLTSGSVQICEKDEDNIHRNYKVTISTVAIGSKEDTTSFALEVPVTFELTKTDSANSSLLLEGATYDVTFMKDSKAVTTVQATTDATGKLSATAVVDSYTYSKSFDTTKSYIAGTLPKTYSSTTQQALVQNAISSGNYYANESAALAASKALREEDWLNAIKNRTSNITVKYKETSAPSGYELSSKEKTTSSITVNSYAADSSGVYKPTTTVKLTATDTNTPYSGTRKTVSKSATYNVSVPVSFQVTKKDGSTNDLLSGADFSITGTISSNTTGVNLSLANSTSTGTTDSNGVVTYSTNLTGSFTKNATCYYYDLSSLAGSAKTEAQKEIDSNSNVFATQAEAEAAALKEVESAAQTTANALKDVELTFKATETKAPSGYNLPANAATSKTATLGELTYDSTKKLFSTNVSAKTDVTNTATDGVTAKTSASSTYTYEIPVTFTLTKTDEAKNTPLANATYSVAMNVVDPTGTVTLPNTSSQSVTTNDKGEATVTNTLTGTFQLETGQYSYYTDYSSLKGEALTKATAAIDNKTVFKTKEDADAKAKQDLAELLKAKQESLKTISVSYTATETKAPDGYTLSSTELTTNAVSPTDVQVNGTKLSSTISLNLEATDKPIEPSIDVIQAVANEFTYKIPLETTLKKVNAETNDGLQGAEFTIQSKLGEDNFTDTVTQTTDDNGLLTDTREITDTFKVKTSAYLYYTNYDSLVSTAKIDADAKIASGEVYKTKADAEAARDAEITKLLEEYTEKNITSQSVQVQATEIKAPTGYVLDMTAHVSDEVKPSNYTLNGSTLTYETVKFDLGTIKNVQYLVEKVDKSNTSLENAELQVVDSSDTVIDSWVSAAEPHAVDGLKANQTYTLVETKAPKGYAIAKPIEFTTDAEATTKVTMTDVKISISLLDEHDMPVEGAQLQLTDEDGNVIATWTVTDEPYIPEGLEVGKKYTITEIYTPDGFNQMQPYTFTVGEEDMNIVVRNGATLLYKKSPDEKEVKGAELQLESKDGTVIDSWVSGQEIVQLTDELKQEADTTGVAYLIDNKEDTLSVSLNKEPDESNNSTTLADSSTTVSDIVSETTSDTALASEDEDIVSYNEPNKQASDSDANTEKTIVMQKIKLAYTKNCYTLITQYSDDTWTYQEVNAYGNEAGHRASLVEGEEYSFVESKAPKGYEEAATITFKAEAEQSYTLTMYDEYLVEGARNKADTGIMGNSTVIAVAAIAAVILLVLILLVLKKKKSKHTSDNSLN
jgi:hypothetical protein